MIPMKDNKIAEGMSLRNREYTISSTSGGPAVRQKWGPKPVQREPVGPSTEMLQDLYRHSKGEDERILGLLLWFFFNEPQASL